METTVVDEIEVLRASCLRDARVVAGFSTRRGGVSGGPFAGLNLWARDDDPGAVAENTLRFCRACGLDRCPPALQRQVHGRTVRWVGAPDGPSPSAVRGLEGDALVTRAPGVPVAVLVADCVPILLWDPEGPAVAAVHAGWRGTARGIVTAVLEEMRARVGTEPSRVRAAIGPAICGDCYEVGPQVAGELLDVLDASDVVSSPPGERERVDLRRANRALLRRAGVPDDAIEEVGGCTCCGRDLFSYRRDGPRSGRQMGVIQLR